MTSLRQRLLNGSRVYGPMVLSDSPIVTELLALVDGYDFLVLDHEHAITDIASGQGLLRAVDAAASAPCHNNTTTTTGGRKRTEPIVRIPGAHDPVYMKKVLDSLRLPGGILVPMVEDARTAQAIVRATRYPLQNNHDPDDDENAIPGGIRGCAVPFIRASSFNFQSNYMEEAAQRDLLVMVQVETMQGVDAIAEIAQVPGIDGIFLGPLDLSCAMGEMGQFHKRAVMDTIQKAEQAILEYSPNNNVFLAGFRSPNRSVAEMFEAGYRLVCGTADLGLLRTAAIQDAHSGQSAISKLERHVDSKITTTTTGDKETTTNDPIKK